MKTMLAAPSTDRKDQSAAGTPPIPVVHIITKLELGGAQQNTLYTVSHLDRRRFAPYLIAGCGGLLDEEARRLDGVRLSWVPSLIREIRPWRDLLAWIALRRRLWRIREEAGPVMIVHTHSSKAGILGRWAAAMAGATAIVHTDHGFGFNDEQPWWLRRFLIWLERLTAQVADAAIVVSEANQRLGERLGLFGRGEGKRPSRPQSRLIRSGIEFSSFRTAGASEKAAMRKTLGLGPGALVVVTVACLKPQKAPLDLVAVAQRVAQEMPDVRFVVIGDGELRPAMEAQIDAARLRDRVALLGWRRDVPELLQAADLFLLTSRWEGLPRSILEAMLAGLPVVATAVDGVGDVVQDGVNGYLISAGDVDRIARRVVELLRAPALRHRMGEAARALPGEFDIDRMVRQQEALYLELLQAKGVAAP
ncbi:MAG: glycosyltransferase family 4 protein [Nitrospirota bacterium]